eukprot:SAG31_NODE_281_length_18584_cov_10.762564_1_plen_153_part_00
MLARLGGSDSDDEETAPAPAPEKNRTQRGNRTKVAVQAKPKVKLPRHVVTDQIRFECPALYKDTFWRSRLGPMNDIFREDGGLVDMGLSSSALEQQSRARAEGGKSRFAKKQKAKQKAAKLARKQARQEKKSRSGTNLSMAASSSFVGSDAS